MAILGADDRIVVQTFTDPWRFVGRQDVTISGWYAGNARAQLQSIDTGDGLKLDSQLQQLVGAMATYSASNPGFNPTQSSQMPADQTLQNAIAAAWH